MDARYKNLDNDERGVWKSSDLSVGPAVERNIYSIFNPYTKQEIYPPHGRSWVYSQEKLQELIADNRIFFPTRGSGVPRYKRFLNEVKQGVTPMSLWTYQEVGHTQDAMREIKELFEGQALFDTPKPEALISRILEISTKENDLVLDFFAGSGTTCAVAHKLKRKYIGIEMGEHFDSVILPRLKKVIGGFKSGALKEFNKGGVVKVYELESYEEILRKIKYEDNNKPLAYDEQYSDLVECKNESYTLNIEALEKMGVDIKETLENLHGVGVEFFNEKVVKFKGNDKEVEILKALKEALIW
ncbi:hypothetical protein VN1202_05340 [Helicobacter pylori]|nr:hypothetical protein VN1202_05340 [Helicobacter pylori]